jgi:phosphoribosyl 1,2-cyclic phosphate phosphodiesterase
MSIRFTLLGTGSSMGVPRADGFFGNCDPKNKKNYRTRCSALISSEYSNTLIDTSPDLRSQLLAQKVTSIDRVLYSHMHADQTHGINDLRIFSLKNKKKIPVYADKLTQLYLKKNFSYCFKKKYDYPATLKLNFLKKNLIFYEKKNKITIRSIPVEHGLINCIAFIINNKLAYASDINGIQNKYHKYFKNLDFLVIDCLRIKKHPSHYNLFEVLELIKFFKPKKAILTNMHSDLDYKYLLKILPKNILPGYDGITLNI